MEQHLSTNPDTIHNTQPAVEEVFDIQLLPEQAKQQLLQFYPDKERANTLLRSYQETNPEDQELLSDNVRTEYKNNLMALARNTPEIKSIPYMAQIIREYNQTEKTSDERQEKKEIFVQAMTVLIDLVQIDAIKTSLNLPKETNIYLIDDISKSFDTKARLYSTPRETLIEEYLQLAEKYRGTIKPEWLLFDLQVDVIAYDEILEQENNIVAEYLVRATKEICTNTNQSPEKLLTQFWDRKRNTYAGRQEILESLNNQLNRLTPMHSERENDNRIIEEMRNIHDAKVYLDAIDREAVPEDQVLTVLIHGLASLKTLLRFSIQTHALDNQPHIINVDSLVMQYEKKLGELVRRDQQLEDFVAKRIHINIDSDQALTDKRLHQIVVIAEEQCRKYQENSGNILQTTKNRPAVVVPKGQQHQQRIHSPLPSTTGLIRTKPLSQRHFLARRKVATGIAVGVGSIAAATYFLNNGYKQRDTQSSENNNIHEKNQYIYAIDLKGRNPWMSEELIQKQLDAYNSPLPANVIYNYGKKLGIEPSFFLAIAYYESFFGAAQKDSVYNNSKTYNPLNIRYAPSEVPESGYVDPNVNPTGEFAIFKNITEGIEAGYWTIKDNYIDKGITTIEAFINKWAPPGDKYAKGKNANDTETYISFVKFVLDVWDKDEIRLATGKLEKVTIHPGKKTQPPKQSTENTFGSIALPSGILVTSALAITAVTMYRRQILARLRQRRILNHNSEPAVQSQQEQPQSEALGNTTMVETLLQEPLGNTAQELANQAEALAKYMADLTESQSIRYLHGKFPPNLANPRWKGQWHSILPVRYGSSVSIANIEDELPCESPSNAMINLSDMQTWIKKHYTSEKGDTGPDDKKGWITYTYVMPVVQSPDYDPYDRTGNFVELMIAVPPKLAKLIDRAFERNVYFPNEYFKALYPDLLGEDTKTKIHTFPAVRILDLDLRKDSKNKGTPRTYPQPIICGEVRESIPLTAEQKKDADFYAAIFAKISTDEESTQKIASTLASINNKEIKDDLNHLITQCFVDAKTSAKEIVDVLETHKEDEEKLRHLQIFFQQKRWS